MSVFKAILIASLSMPALVFIIFFTTGVVFMVSEAINSGEYNNGWLVIVFAGSIYAYLSLLLSTAPTIVLGLLISSLANKYGILNHKVIFAGAPVLGGLFLATAAILFFRTVDIELVMWSFIAGCVGGLFNAYVFQKVKRPNIGLQIDAAARRD